MTWEGWVTLGVVVMVLVALARNWASPDAVFAAALTLLMSFSLASDRFPSPRQMAAVFGNEGLLTVGVLFVVAAALTETGGLSLITERLLGRPRKLLDAQLRMMAPVTFISAFLNNTPVVAMFTPVIHDWCKKSGLSPSKLFIPLSYAAIFGGCCTIIGTSTNLVVQGFLIDAGLPRMQMWTLAAVGVPVAIAGWLFIILFGRKLLPERTAMKEQLADPRRYTVEMMVQPGSTVDGQTIEQAGLRHLPGMYLVEIERDGERLVAVGPQQVLHGNDRLIFVGVVESVVDLQRIRGLVPATEQVFKLSDPRPDRVLVEAVVSNTCPMVGKSVREGRFRSRYDAAVIAVHRNGHRIDRKIGDIVLAAGDTLLLETHPRFLDAHRNSRDFFLASAVANSQMPRHERAYMALAILLGMVVVMSLENVFHLSIFNVVLIGAALMLLSGCLSGEQARRSIDWSTLVAIGCSFGVGKAMDTSGAARYISENLLSAFHQFGPWGVLAGVYLITILFTEVVTNNAAAALSFPIAYAAAQTLGVNFMPFAVTIAMAASCGFAVPTGYATHLMVHGPGGYRFSDWLRIGIPMDILVMIVTVTLAPIMFPFR